MSTYDTFCFVMSEQAEHTKEALARVDSRTVSDQDIDAAVAIVYEFRLQCGLLDVIEKEEVTAETAFALLKLIDDWWNIGEPQTADGRRVKSFSEKVAVAIRHMLMLDEMDAATRILRRQRPQLQVIEGGRA